MDELPPYVATLNERQREAVVHGKAPLLILAGAGSGKTRVITTRIAYLIDRLSFTPDQILAVTFTNKAAREMQERVDRFLVESGREADSAVMIKTFHSFCSWFLRRNAAAAGLSPYFGIYDDDDALALIKTVVPEHLPTGEVRALLNAISRAKDDNLTPDDDLGGVSAHPEFPEVYRRYEEKLTASGNVDFGGLIQKTLMVLHREPAITSRLRQKFQVVLVDEYQDCNGAQSLLLEALYGPQTWLAVVGDDDQSIYRFRGADVSHILNFPQKFPGTVIVRLEQNYRSTGSILEVASQVVARNQGRLGKTLWTSNPVGDKPRLVYLNDQDEEADWAVELIRRAPLTETAILYRTNAQSRAFESALVRAKLPYRLVGTVRFYEREEIKDVLAWLKFLCNSRDEVSFFRIVNKPARGLGKAAQSQIEQRRRTDWLDACGLALADLKGKAKAGLGQFLELYSHLSLLAKNSRSLSDLVQQVIEHSGLGEHHSQHEDLGEAKEQNLDELVNAAAPFPGTLEGLVQFLENVELDASGTLEDQPGVTTLITMHNTKGLEFDRVLVTGLEDGLFPRDTFDPQEIEEERRLFYVAVTRARQELLFSACRTRLQHGKFQDRAPSRFLAEIDPDSLEIVGAAGGGELWAVGQRVFHDDFGVGTVVKKWYNGSELGLDVRFDSGRMGRFMPAYTPLEKVAADE